MCRDKTQCTNVQQIRQRNKTNHEISHRHKDSAAPRRTAAVQTSSVPAFSLRPIAVCTIVGDAPSAFTLRGESFFARVTDSFLRLRPTFISSDEMFYTLESLPSAQNMNAEDDGLVCPEVGTWAEEKYRLLALYDELFSTGMKPSGISGSISICMLGQVRRIKGTGKESSRVLPLSP